MCRASCCWHHIAGGGAVAAFCVVLCDWLWNFSPTSQINLCSSATNDKSACQTAMFFKILVRISSGSSAIAIRICAVLEGKVERRSKSICRRQDFVKCLLFGSHHYAGHVVRQGTDIHSSSSSSSSSFSLCVSGISVFVWGLLVPPGSVKTGRIPIRPQRSPSQCI